MRRTKEEIEEDRDREAETALRRKQIGLHIGLPFWGLYGSLDARLRNGCVEWTSSFNSDEQPPEGLLAAFLKLEKASDEEIVSFTKKWGPFGLEYTECCTNSYPHPPLSEEERTFYFYYSQHTSVWRLFASRLEAFLEAGMALTQGQEPETKYWALILETSKDAGFSWPSHLKHIKGDVAFQRHIFAEELSFLVGKATSRPRIEWNEETMDGETQERPIFNMSGLGASLQGLMDQMCPEQQGFHNSTLVRRVRDGQELGEIPTWRMGENLPPNMLFNILVYQLATALCQKDTWYKCAWCQSWFASDRKLRSDRRHPCGEKCRSVADREKTRMYRRRRQENETQSGG